VEPAVIPEVCKGERIGKEELPTQVPLLGIEKIHQIPFPINDPIGLACLSCFGFCCSVGRGSAVLGLLVAVVAELITPLDDVLVCCHGG